MSLCVFGCLAEKVYVSSHVTERESVLLLLWSCGLIVLTTPTSFLLNKDGPAGACIHTLESCTVT